MKVLHVALALFFSCASLAQTKTDNKSSIPTNEAVVLISDLNVDRYNALFKALEREPYFSIVTACIPAHVLHITWNNKSAGTESEIRKFMKIASQCDLSEVKHMPNWGVKEFEEKCIEARNSSK